MTSKEADDQPRHRPGIFKQQNKVHKTGRHRSKGSICIATKGKPFSFVSSLQSHTPKIINCLITLLAGRIQKCSVKKVTREMTREARRNQAHQLRKNKRDEFMKLVRNQNDPPFIVALVSLSSQISYFGLLDMLNTCDAVETSWSTGYGHPVIRY